MNLQKKQDQQLFERLYKPKIENIIYESIVKVNNFCEENLKDNTILSLSKYKPNLIIEEFDEILNNEIPLIVRNDEFFSKIQEEGKDKITKQIEICKKKRICSKIQFNIIDKSKTQLNEILNKYEEKISKYQGNNLKEILPTEEEIKKEIFQFIKEIFQNSCLSEDFLIDIYNEMNKLIHKKIEKLHIEGYRKYYPLFIDKLIKKLKTKCEKEKNRNPRK